MDTYTVIDREFRELLRGYAPSWRLVWGNSPVTAGLCNYRDRVIKLSRPIADLNPLETYHVVPIHELSHVLTPGHHHDNVWRDKCLELGGDGKRLHSLVTPSEPYRGYCTCGRVFKRYRRPRKGTMCAKCKVVLDWFDDRTGERLSSK